MTFEQIKTVYHWRPIPNCPGRYKLIDGDPLLTLDELVNKQFIIHQFRSKRASDLILIVLLDQGGFISYQRKNGTFVHTLNTPEGFQRKLFQLEICLDFAKF